MTNWSKIILQYEKHRCYPMTLTVRVWQWVSVHNTTTPKPKQRNGIQPSLIIILRVKKFSVRNVALWVFRLFGESKFHLHQNKVLNHCGVALKVRQLIHTAFHFIATNWKAVTSRRLCWPLDLSSVAPIETKSLLIMLLFTFTRQRQ